MRTLSILTPGIENINMYLPILFCLGIDNEPDFMVFVFFFLNVAFHAESREENI